MIKLPTTGPRLLFLNAAVGGIAGILKVLVNLALLPVMARLLGPEEFGLYALAFPIVTFFTVLADGGIGLSLAREDEKSKDIWSTAFWMLLLICTIISIFVSIIGVILGLLSDQPRLAPIISFLSINFLFMALSALPAARLVRRGNLVVLSIGDIISVAAGGCVAVYLAQRGAGAWSLACQYATSSAVRMLILNAAAFEKPKFTFLFADIWPHMTTGSSIISSRLIELIGRSIENFSYEKNFQAPALGVYTLSNQISRFLCEAISNPLWSSLYSHSLTSEKEKIAAVHARLTRFLASVLFPASVVFSCSAPQLIPLVFGEKWLQATPLVQILIPFYAINAVFSLCGAVLLAEGFGKLILFNTSILSIGRILAVALGPIYGQVGVVWGVGIASIIFVVCMSYTTIIYSGAGSATIFKGLDKVLYASIISAVFCLWMIDLNAVNIYWVISVIILSGFVYLGSLIILGGRLFINDAVDVINLFKKKL